jgi:predicted transcriptional regulator
MKYRSRTEIVYDILQTARSDGSDGAGKTKIMYSAFLSYAQMKDYLAVMTDNNLLQYDLGTRRFKITDRGLNFLKIYDEIDYLTEKEQLQD